MTLASRRPYTLNWNDRRILANMGEEIAVYIAAGAGVFTALATGVSAWIAWRQHLGQLSVDWHLEWRSDKEVRRLFVECTVHNRTTISFGPSSMVVTGAAAEVRPSRGEKHESWPTNEASLGSTKVSPNQSERYSCTIFLDWPSLQNQLHSERFRSSKRSISVRIKVTLWSMSSRRRKRSFTTRIKVPARTINEMAEKA